MLKTFSIGGIHPRADKLSASSTVEPMPAPDSVVVPLSQHIGVPASAVVAVGDAVHAGQLIAKAEGFISANVHAPISGTVKKITDYTDASGVLRPAVMIEGDGVFEDGVGTIEGASKDYGRLSPTEIVELIKAAGIVGMGGATFPTHVKLTIPEGRGISHLLLNGAECEPYLTSDHRTMLERGRDVIVGADILSRAVGAANCVIGVEENKRDAVDALKLSAKELLLPVEVVTLKERYPQGGEKQLIDAILRKRVPSGGLPADVGVVVHNVGTAVAVYEAVCFGRPLIERVVTVTGKGIARPRNLSVRIGTPLSSLLAHCGGLNEDAGKVILGGPMMGRATANLEAPVTKGTSGVLVMPKSESLRGRVGNCLRCAKCVGACPMGLEPYLLSKYAEQAIWNDAEKHFITDCIECGSCSYICPANLPLLDYIRLGKSEVMKIRRSRKA